MLKNAYPLMEIYRSERKNELNAFLLADTKQQANAAVFCPLCRCIQ